MLYKWKEGTCSLRLMNDEMSFDQYIEFDDLFLVLHTFNVNNHRHLKLCFHFRHSTFFLLSKFFFDECKISQISGE